MPGSRGAGMLVLHQEDYRVRAELQGAAEAAGSVPRVREGYGKGITGDAPPNP